jgi:hypothetical protein
MPAQSHPSDQGSPRADRGGPDGPTGIAAVVPALTLLVVILAIMATVVLFSAMWATAVGVLATVCMAVFLMFWMNHLLSGHGN